MGGGFSGLRGLVGGLAQQSGFGYFGQQFLHERAQRAQSAALRAGMEAQPVIYTGKHFKLEVQSKAKTVIQELQEETDEWLKDIKIGDS